MKDRPRGKRFVVRAPQAIVDNASWTCNVIDTLGAKRLTVYVMLGATDIAMVALKLQESNVKASDTALTSGVDVPGCVFGTSNGKYSGSASALPSATDDNGIFAFDVPLDGNRKRYQLLVATAGDGATGTFLTAWAELDMEDAPDSAADRGLVNVLQAA